MEQKEENSESTNSPRESENAATVALAFLRRFHGLLEVKGYGNLPLESISEFLNAVEKFAMIARARGFIILNRGDRRIWRLHKNTNEFHIVLLGSPTNNNTHTPASQPVTP